MRRFFVLAIVFAVGAAAWLLLDADPDGRQALVDRLADAVGMGEEETPPPNWGDVATKVGEFTEADRELREVLNPALAGAAEETPPASAATE